MAGLERRSRTWCPVTVIRPAAAVGPIRLLTGSPYAAAGLGFLARGRRIRPTGVVRTLSGLANQVNRAVMSISLIRAFGLPVVTRLYTHYFPPTTCDFRDFDGLPVPSRTWQVDRFTVMA